MKTWPKHLLTFQPNSTVSLTKPKLNRLADVRKFFATTGEIAADISSTFAPSHGHNIRGSSGGVGGGAGVPVGSGVGGNGGISVGAHVANLPPSLATTHFIASNLPALSTTVSDSANNAAGVAGDNIHAAQALDDVLEGITVHYAVHLTSILGHYSEDIRVQSVFLLFDLATIFDKSAQEFKKYLGKLTLGFQMDDKGSGPHFRNSSQKIAKRKYYHCCRSVRISSRAVPLYCSSVKQHGDCISCWIGMLLHL
jgi:hypothetical protein